MKWLCIALICANLLVFTTGSGDVSLFGSKQREPERVQRQIAPEVIRIIEPKRVALLEQRARGQASDGVTACMELGPFSGEDVARAEAAFGRLDLGARLITRRVEEPTTHMVYLASPGSLEAAQRRVDELRRLGIDDMTVLQENGALKFAISLGQYKSEEIAQKRASELGQAGVKNVRILARAGTLQKNYYAVRFVDNALKSRLEGMRAEVTNTDWRDCPGG